MNTIISKAIREAVKRSPEKPGCYFWKSTTGEILYVGKAKNLKNRLHSYIRGNSDNIRIFNMLEQARSIEYIITQTENEALLLEANIVKRHAPRFNVRLKDDKSYPYLCISISEAFPQIFITRNIKDDNKLYFGPYSDVKATRATLAMIHKIFPIRKVRQKLPLKRAIRPCMNFHINRCLAPCQKNVSEEEYRKIINEILLFLEGKTEILEKQLAERMKSYSASKSYEKAAIYRDMIYAVRRINEKQLVQIHGTDKDVLALARKDDHGQIAILEIRNGRMIGCKSFPLQGLSNVSDEEVFGSFVRDYYLSLDDIPNSIQIPVKLKEKKLISATLFERTNRKINFNHFLSNSSNKNNLKEKTKERSQRIGMTTSAGLYHSAKQNVEFLLQDRLLALRSTNQDIALDDLKEMLGLTKRPQKMECYDISHIQGFETVGAGIVFWGARPKPSAYRHYKIKETKGINDPASIKEVIKRRIQKLLKEEAKLPDIILIDGGITQVNAAYEAASELGQNNLYILSLAKKYEELYFPKNSIPSSFDPNRPGMRLLRYMRDEAHRFAVRYHRSRRNQITAKHVIEDLENIGQVRKKALLKHFSKNFIEKTNMAELKQISGIGPQIAKQIYDLFKNKNILK